LLHDGQLRAAADAARRAAGQFRDTVGRELCREVAHVADAFGGAPPHPADRWYDVLRAASRRGPMAAAARAYAAAESATTAGDPRAANIWSLVAALAETLAGRLTSARRTLHRLEHADEPFHTGLIARLALAALIPADERAVVGGEAVALDADLRDSSWIARLARGIVAARSGTGVGAIVAECDRLGDAWGALFISLADAVAVARTRAATPDLVALEGLGSRARAVEAGTVEAWALALHALAVATAELADAKPGARAAESFARAAGVPGAQAVAYAAIGISSTYPQRAEMLDLAAATATSVGLDCCLWESRQPEPLPVVALRAVERGPAPLHLRCFGGLQIAVGDEPVDLALLRPRARSALRRLALDADRPIHREILLESLWPDLSVAPAMHNLQVTVSSLRSVLDPSARRGSSRLIVRDGECYRLALPPGSSSDLHDFAAALDRAAGAQAVDEAGVAVSALQSALSIHADDLFPEEGPAEWVVGNRERMRLQAAEAGRLLAELLLARGDTDAAAAAAERSVQLDPYRDSSWRLLISAREQTGDLAASSQARRAYQEVLDSLSVPVNTFGHVGS
jgi:DNA-binding SARP family transcriptional activator